MTLTLSGSLFDLLAPLCFTGFLFVHFSWPFCSIIIMFITFYPPWLNLHYFSSFSRSWENGRKCFVLCVEFGREILHFLVFNNASSTCPLPYSTSSIHTTNKRYLAWPVLDLLIHACSLFEFLSRNGWRFEFFEFLFLFHHFKKTKLKNLVSNFNTYTVEASYLIKWLSEELGV